MAIIVVGWNTGELLNPDNFVARRITADLEREDTWSADSYSECTRLIDIMLQVGEHVIKLAGAWGEDCVAGLAAYALARGAEVIIYFNYILTHSECYTAAEMVSAVKACLRVVQKVQLSFEYSYDEESNTLHLNF
jgi:hypothetical protein